MRGGEGGVKGGLEWAQGWVEGRWIGAMGKITDILFPHASSGILDLEIKTFYLLVFVRRLASINIK